MNRPLFAALAVVVSSSFFPVHSHAVKLTRAESGRVGNGGFAYVCRDADKKIVVARLLDLWGAEGIPAWSKNDPVDAQITAALERLKAISPNGAVSVSEYIVKFQKTAIFSNRSLNPTEDAFPPYRPEAGCGYEQVARYEPLITETGRSGVRIASEIFNSPYFSNSDRAALYFHEAAYFVDRERNKATNSRLARMIVAHLFSDTTMPNTVRLAAAALLVGKTRAPTDGSEGQVQRTAVAVPDLSKIQYSIQFDKVDGINSMNLHAMKSSQRSAKYQCYALAWDLTKPKATLVGTKWVTLTDLVQVYVYDTDPKAVRINGYFRALETLPEVQGTEVQNSIYVACEKKDVRGNITPVKFEGAVLKLPEGESLYVSRDESLTTSPGRTPLSPSLNSRNELTPMVGGRKQYLGEFLFELVQGVF